MNIKVNSTLMIPIYEQIVDQIKTLIRIGKLEENDMLPSVRSLSKELKISALTVKKAYDYLVLQTTASTRTQISFVNRSAGIFVQFKNIINT